MWEDESGWVCVGARKKIHSCLAPYLKLIFSSPVV